MDMKTTTRNILLGFALAVGVLALLAAVPSQTDFDGTYFKTNTLPISLTGNLVNWQQRATNSFSSHWVDSGTSDATLAGTASVGGPIQLTNSLTFIIPSSTVPTLIDGYFNVSVGNDPILQFGHNFARNDETYARVNPAEPQLVQRMEANVSSPGGYLMEWNVDYKGTNNVVRRLLLEQINKTNDAILTYFDSDYYLFQTGYVVAQTGLSVGAASTALGALVARTPGSTNATLALNTSTNGATLSTVAGTGGSSTLYIQPANSTIVAAGSSLVITNLYIATPNTNGKLDVGGEAVVESNLFAGGANSTGVFITPYHTYTYGIARTAGGNLSFRSNTSSDNQMILDTGAGLSIGGTMNATNGFSKGASVGISTSTQVLVAGGTTNLQVHVGGILVSNIANYYSP